MIFVNYYTAAWCAPCKRLKPMAKKIAREAGAEFAEIDVDREEGYVPEYVKGVPTIIISDGFKILSTLSPDMVNPQALRKALGT